MYHYLPFVKNPLDARIQKVQAALDAYLGETWKNRQGAPEPVDDIVIYPRVYRNHKDGGYVAEWYDTHAPGGGEYKEAYFDDALNAVFFFGVSDRETVAAGENTVEVHLVAFVHVDRIKHDLGYRGDREIRQDLQRFFYDGPYGFQLESIETGLQRILREYGGSWKGLQAVELAPLHCFRLNFSVTIDPLAC